MEPIDNMSFQKLLSSFEGKVCWAVVEGEGVGTMFSAHFGEKFSRRIRPRDEATSSEDQRYEGEFIVFANMCRWTVRDGSALVCDSDASGLTHAVIGDALRRIVGSAIISLIFEANPIRLYAVFDNRISVEIVLSEHEEYHDDDSVFILEDATEVWWCNFRGSTFSEPR